MTEQQLKEVRMSEDDAAHELGLTVYDVALPQPWIDRFVRKTGLDYWLVLSTTFWSYDRLRIGGEPVSICDEVQAAIAKHGFCI